MAELEVANVSGQINSPIGPPSSTSSFDLLSSTSMIYERCENLLQHKFQSVVIVGLRGVGKSTLALMALATLGLEYVDLERCLVDYTGVSDATFIKSVSKEEFIHLQYKLIVRSFRANKNKRAIYVLPASSINNSAVMEYLRNNCNCHCVINIECDEDRILKYVNYTGEYQKGILSIQSGISQYRSVANYNFFNLESNLDVWKKYSFSKVDDSKQIEVTPHLILKPVELEFINFMSFILWNPIPEPSDVLLKHYQRSNLRSFSNCLQLTFPYDARNIHVNNFGDVLNGVDAIEVGVDLIQLIRTKIMHVNLRLDEYIARIRRSTRGSIPILVGIKNTIPELNNFIMESTVDSVISTSQIKQDFRSFYFSILYSIIKVAADYVVLNLEIFLFDEVNFLNDIIVNDSFYIMDQLRHMQGNSLFLGTYNSNCDEFWAIQKTIGKVRCLDIIDLTNDLQISMVRVTSTARCVSDNYKIQTFLEYCMKKYPETTVSAYNQGTNGKISKILNKVLTPVCSPSADPLQGELTSYALNQSRFSCFLQPTLRFFAVGRSDSSILYQFVYRLVFEKLGLSYFFKILEDVSIDELLKSPDFGGAILATPIEIKANEFAGKSSAHAAEIGLVDSIIAERSLDDPSKFLLRGENADCLAIKVYISDNVAPINAVSHNKSVLVIGSGFKSRAAIYSLMKLGYKNILLYSPMSIARQTEKDVSLSHNLDSSRKLDSHNLLAKITIITEEQFQNGILPDDLLYPTIIINCMSDEDVPIDGQVKLSANWLKSPSGGIFLDTHIANKEITTLNESLEWEKGWIKTNGLEFLLAKTLIQFELFVGKPAPRELIKSILIEHYPNEVQ